MKAFFREFLLTIAIAAVIVIAFQITVGNYVVIMSSMEPSFHEEQRLLVNKAIYIFSEPQRGDVVIFKAPAGRNGDYIKRIIALPGDTVEIKEEAVYVNNSRLDEPYITSPPKYTMEKREVPENEYFVLGDNRNNSDDSHYNWTLPHENIIGKAWLSIWPPDLWGLAANYPLQEQIASATGN